MTHLLNDAGNTAIWTGAAAIAAWVIQYSVLAPWWRNLVGITIVGLAVCVEAIYLPSLLALADPAHFASFSQANWYHWLATGIVIAVALFMLTRIAAWEQIRRYGRKPDLRPDVMATRIAELEAEVERLRAGSANRESHG